MELLSFITKSKIKFSDKYFFFREKEIKRKKKITLAIYNRYYYRLICYMAHLVTDSEVV